MRNRFKGLDLTECMKNYGQKLLMLSRPFLRKRKAKWLSKEALQRAEKRREAKGKGEKERYNYLNVEFKRIARRDKKAFSVISAKK